MKGFLPDSRARGRRRFITAMRALALLLILPAAAREVPITSTEGWATYRNAEQAFQIDYPGELRARTGGGLFYYSAARDGAGFSVCFASPDADAYCEFEIYVVTEGRVNRTDEDFLGASICRNQSRLSAPPRFDGLAATEINTSCDEGSQRRNAYAVREGKAYIFATEPALGVLENKNRIFDEMLRTFVWLPAPAPGTAQPETAASAPGADASAASPAPAEVTFSASTDFGAPATAPVSMAHMKKPLTGRDVFLVIMGAMLYLGCVGLLLRALFPSPTTTQGYMFAGAAAALFLLPPVILFLVFLF